MRRINEGVKKLDRKAKALSKKVKSYTDATWSQDEKTRRAAFKARDEAQKKAVATYQRLGRKQAEGSMRPLRRAVESGKKLMQSTPENLKDRLMRKHGHKLKKKKVNEAKSPAWQRKAGKNPEGGLNQKGVASYRAANPGSKLKTAVTTKPSKLKKGSNSAKRRKSFCARMSGMKKRLTSKKTANDPDSRINKSLRKWNC